jgi:hypothetical protein
LNSAVSRVFNPPRAAEEIRSADFKSAIRQVANLRYDGSDFFGAI